MNLIEEAIENWWGQRCSTYDEDCYCCNAWLEYDILWAEIISLRERVENETI